MSVIKVKTFSEVTDVSSKKLLTAINLCVFVDLQFVLKIRSDPCG